MRTIKVIGILLVAIVMSFSLAACGSNGGNVPQGSGHQSAASEASSVFDTETFSSDLTSESNDEIVPQGSDYQSEAPVVESVYEVGAFSVALPTGWAAFPQTKDQGGRDENGNLPIDEKTILLAKGADDELDAMNGPNIRIHCYGNDVMRTGEEIGDYFINGKDIDVVINGKKCVAYRGEYTPGCFYDYIEYEAVDLGYDIWIQTAVNGNKTGISWDSEDVQLILNSLTGTEKYKDFFFN